MPFAINNFYDSGTREGKEENHHAKMRHTIGAVRTTNEMAPTRRIKKRFMSFDVGFPDEDWSRRFVPQLRRRRLFLRLLGIPGRGRV